MSKSYSKFNAGMQKDYPYLEKVPGSETDVVCKLCNGHISVADGGRYRINQHIITQKHKKASETVTSNKTITSFLSTDKVTMQLQGKELTFSYHSSRHQMSKRTADCTAKLVSKVFDPKFTCGATKTGTLVNQVVEEKFFIIIVQDKTNNHSAFSGYLSRN